ncbi:MAG TPA: mechanosensitive ion channel, partial [bacterium]|nr:mechanosensitive ion channel [bacterium]
MDIATILDIIGDWFIHEGLKILLIIILTLVAIKGVQLFTSRLSALISKRKLDEEYKKRADTLGSVIQHLLNVFIIVIAVIMFLGQIGVEIGPILAAAGIVGLASGFGAQS